MALLKGLGDFFALDIGTNAVRVVQLSQSGPDSWNLQHYGYAPVDEKITSNDSAEGLRRLGEVIMTAVGQMASKLKTLLLVYLQTRHSLPLSMFQQWARPNLKVLLNTKSTNIFRWLLMRPR